MAVHAAHERLVVMASTLLHAIIESKTPANARAYKDSETEKTRHRKATFAQALAAELKTRQHASSASGIGAASPRQLPSHLQRHATGSLESSLLSRTHHEDESAQRAVSLEEEPLDLAERGRIPSRSGSRLRRALAADAGPPVLSANYDLRVDKKSAAVQTTPDGATPKKLLLSTCATTSDLARVPLRLASDSPLSHLRPKSSPSTRNTAPGLQLSLATYSDAPFFVEPSPLSKRMSSRGITSANGVRRRLHFKKRPPQRIPTPIVNSLSVRASDAASTSEAEVVDQERETERLVPDTSRSNETTSVSPDTSETVQADTAPPNASATSDSDDESYEDDFADESESVVSSRLNDAAKLDSDSELIDLLHDKPLLEPFALSPAPAVADVTATAAAATCIQRHVRGHAARRAMRCSLSGDTRASRASKVGCADGSSRAVTESRKRAPSSSKQSAKTECRQVADPQQRESRPSLVHASSTLTRCSSSSLTAVKRALSVKSRSASKRPDWVTQIHDFTAGTEVANAAIAGKRSRLGMSAGRQSFPVPVLQRQSAAKSREAVPTSFFAPSATLSASSSSSPHRLDALQSSSRHSIGQSGDRPEQQRESESGADADALKRIQALYAQGLQHQKLNELELAIDAYRTALQIPAAGREFASLHINLGSALMAQLKFADALTSFEYAQRIHATNAKAAYNCALALIHLGRPALAEVQVRLTGARVPCQRPRTDELVLDLSSRRCWRSTRHTQRRCTRSTT